MSVYEEVEIEDMSFDATLRMFSYPCPCGDRFALSLEELEDGEDLANCPSCTLRIRVIYDQEYIDKKRLEVDSAEGASLQNEEPSK